MTQNSSTLTRRFAELAHIADVLPAYAPRFAAPAYSWLTVTYLTESTRPAQEFFARAEQLEGEVLALSTEMLAAKAKVLRLVRGARLALQTSAVFVANSNWADLPSAKTTDLIAQVQAIVVQLAALTEFEDITSTYVDSGRLKHDLASALAAFTNAQSALEGKKLTLSDEQKQYIVYEDAIDDLWHTTTNALDGLFHEEKEILYIFMPWRKRTASTTSTPPTDAAAQPAA